MNKTPSLELDPAEPKAVEVVEVAPAAAVVEVAPAPTAEVELVPEPVLDATPAVFARPVAKPAVPAPGDESMNVLLSAGRAFLGWCWRVLVGPFFCTGYLLSLAALGWLSRHMQGVTLRVWWGQSRFRHDGTFAEFCDSLGPDAPRVRPRWFWRDRVVQAVTAPLPGGRKPSQALMVWRSLGVPIHSLWLNFKAGFQSALGTFLLVGWGCMLMTFSWLFGWHNSFHKGYEIAFLGPALGLVGLLLFIAAMFYVPMAQAHFALTGEFRAFFDVRFIWRLIRARLPFYTGVIALLGLAVVPFEILTIIPKYFEQMNPGFSRLSDAEFAAFFGSYLFWVGAYVFVVLLVTRHLMARVYASAVLAVLRRGHIMRSELNPKLLSWIDRLELDVTPTAEETGLTTAMLKGGGWMSRRVLFTGLFVIWFAVISLRYVREFFNYHPYSGFLNHSLVLLPCPGTVPGDLKKS